MKKNITINYVVKRLIIVTVFTFIYFSIMNSQPYWFFPRIVDSIKGGVLISRFDFTNGLWDTFLSDTIYSYNSIHWDNQQKWLYLTKSDGIERGLIISISNPSIKFELRDSSQLFDIFGVVFNQNVNKFYISWHQNIGDTVDIYKSEIYDAETFQKIDTITIPSTITSFTFNSAISSDGNYIYLGKGDFVTLETYLLKYSAPLNSIVQSKRMRDFYPPTIEKSIVDNKKENFLIGFYYPEGDTIEPKYLVETSEKSV